MTSELVLFEKRIFYFDQTASKSATWAFQWWLCRKRMFNDEEDLLFSALMMLPLRVTIGDFVLFSLTVFFLWSARKKLDLLSARVRKIAPSDLRQIWSESTEASTLPARELPGTKKKQWLTVAKILWRFQFGYLLKTKFQLTYQTLRTQLGSPECFWIALEQS